MLAMLCYAISSAACNWISKISPNNKTSELQRIYRQSTTHVPNSIQKNFTWVYANKNNSPSKTLTTFSTLLWPLKATLIRFQPKSSAVFKNEYSAANIAKCCRLPLSEHLAYFLVTHSNSKHIIATELMSRLNLYENECPGAVKCLWTWNWLDMLLETVMIIWCSIQGVYLELEAEKYPLK